MVETRSSGASGATVFEREAGVVELRELEPRPAAVVRIDVPPAEISDAIGAAFAEVAGAAARAGVAIGGEPFARYVSFGPERIVAEVGFPVAGPLPETGRVHPTFLPGGLVASAVHVGPYDTLHETYARMQAWIAESGRTPGGEMWEVYWSEPVGDPTTWRTEVCWPVA
jgi:effector-binding domain-containing protein